MAPEISIVILSYRDGPELLRTLRNLANSTLVLSLTFEVLVVDVLSSLKIAEVLEIDEIAEKIEIRRIPVPTNHLSVNRNWAMAQAKSPLLLFLDADAELTAISFSSLHSEWIRLKTHIPNLAGVGGINLPPQDESFFYDLQRSFQYFFFGHLRSPQMWVPQSAVPVNHLSTVFALFEKTALEKIGGFAKNFPSVCEDQEMGFRLRASGRQIYLSPKAQVIHRSESTFSGWFRRVYRFGMGQGPVMLSHPQAFLSSKSAVIFGAPVSLLLIRLLIPKISSMNFSVLEFAQVVFGVYFLLLSSWVFGGWVFRRKAEGMSFRVALILPFFSTLNHLLYGVAVYLGLFKAIAQRLWQSFSQRFRQRFRKVSNLS